MTIEVANPITRSTISGIGPYAIEWPYFAETLQLTIERDGTFVPVDPADFTVTPLSSLTAGNVFLAPAIAAANAGKKLVIQRATLSEQGWQSTQGEREYGLEVQLDRLTMRVQELQAEVKGSLRVLGKSVDYIWPAEDQTIIWKDGKFIAGPSAGQIAGAEASAISAAASAAAALAALYKIGLPFNSFAEAEAAIIPAPVQFIHIWHNGMLLSFQDNSAYSCVADATGRKFGPLAGHQVFWEHWQLSTRYVDPTEIVTLASIDTLMASYPDAAPAMSRAMTEHHGIILAMGYLKVASAYTCQRNCVVVNGTGNKISAGFSHVYNNTIRAYGKGGVGDQASKFVNLTFYAPQDPATVNRTDLIRYPFAIDLTNSSRSCVDTCRFPGFVNGVDMRKSRFNSNSGGTNLIDVETGCFQHGVMIDNALDFVNVRGFRSWPFMFSNSPTLTAIFADGLNTGIRVEKCDGFEGDIKQWRNRASFGQDAGTHLILTGDVGWPVEGGTLDQIDPEVITQANTGATGTVDYTVVGPFTEIRLKNVIGTFNTVDQLTGSVSGALGAASVPTLVEAVAAQDNRTIQYKGRLILDGRRSYLQLRSGSGEFDIYSSKIQEEGQVTVKGTGVAYYTLTGMIRSSTHEAVTVDGSGAEITLLGMWCRSEISNVSFARAKVGGVRFKNCRFQWPDDGLSAGVPFIQIDSGAQVTVQGCSAPQMNTYSRKVLNIDADNPNHVVDAKGFGIHTMSWPLNASLGFYSGLNRSDITRTGATAFLERVVSELAGDTYRKIYFKARGVLGALTKLLTGDIIFEEIIKGHDGTAEGQNVAVRRAGVLAEASGKLAGYVDYLVSNAAGAAVNVMKLTAAEAKFFGGLDVNGLLDREFTTRSEFVAAVGAGRIYAPGSVVSAAGKQYVMMPAGHVLYGTNPLPGLPGFAPASELTPEHCGDVGNGADDTAAFVAARAIGRKIVCDRTKTYALNNFRNTTLLDGGGATFKRVAGAECAFDNSSTLSKLINCNFDGDVFDANGKIDPAKAAVSTVVDWPAANQITVADGTKFKAGMTVFFGSTPRLATATLSGTPQSMAGRVASVAGNVITLEQSIGGLVKVGAKIIGDFPLVKMSRYSFHDGISGCSFRRFIVGLETSAYLGTAVGNAFPIFTDIQFYNFCGTGVVQTAGFAGETMATCHLNGYNTVTKTHTATAGQTRFAYDWNVTPKCHRGGAEISIRATVNGVAATATVDESTQEIVLSTPASAGDTVVVRNSEFSPRLFLAHGVVSSGASSIGRFNSNVGITAEVGIEIYGDGIGATVELAFLSGVQIDTCSFIGLWLRDANNIYVNGSSFIFCRYPVVLSGASRNIFMSPLHTDIMPNTSVNTLADSPNTASVTVDPTCSLVCIPADTALEKGEAFSLIDSAGIVDRRKQALLGTVSQSGGVPTGAIIERGSNANGEYVRFADGTQICTHGLSSSSGGNTTWTYPIAFAAAPRLIPNPNTVVGGAALFGNTAGITSTAAEFNVWNVAGARVANGCNLTAIGRWF